MNFRNEAEANQEYIISARRYLHAHPELSFEENETTAYLAVELVKLGVEPHLFKNVTGLWAELGSCDREKGQKTVLLRADIDALPIRENTGLPFASQHDGVMHACGHDGHMAMLLGAVKLLKAHEAELPGRVRILFQPAEESCHGAEYVIREGVLKDVDAVYGSHVWGSLDAPVIDVTPGQRMTSCDNFTIRVKGKAAHGSAPNFGKDAIVSAAAMIMQIQTLVSRKNDPRNSLAITIGEIWGGTVFNVIADEVVMKGTARTHSAEVRDQIEGWLRDVVSFTAKANGTEAELTYEYFPGPVVNDAHLAEIARQCVIELYGEEGIGHLEKPMASEDFAYLTEQIPGMFAFVGIRNEEKGCVWENHNEHFNVDEDALVRGAAMYAQFAWEFLEK